MASGKSRDKDETRPDFMVALGLSPPYSPDDVKFAYLTKVKEAHPDKGGTVEEFNALQEAYDQAKQYVEFRGDRRGWIAAKMDHYLAVQQATESLEELGAEVESDAKDWLEKSFGDFAQLTESIVSVRLVDSENGDRLISAMLENREHLGSLNRLELPGCKVSDSSVLALGVFSQLEHLDLSRTPVTGDALGILEEIPGWCRWRRRAAISGGGPRDACAGSWPAAKRRGPPTRLPSLGGGACILGFHSRRGRSTVYDGASVFVTARTASLG